MPLLKYDPIPNDVHETRSKIAPKTRIRMECRIVLFLWHNVKARAPLPAAACVAHGVRVVVTKIIETGRLVVVVTALFVGFLL